MNYLKLSYLSVLIAFAIVACSPEKKRMINRLTGEYPVDTAIGDYKVLGQPGYRKLKLILLKDRTYHFTPELSILKGYDGNWDLSDDNEYSNFIFKCRNGKYQTNRLLFISVWNSNNEYKIYFKTER
jgi:hypothetical protein